MKLWKLVLIGVGATIVNVGILLAVIYFGAKLVKMVWG